MTGASQEFSTRSTRTRAVANRIVALTVGFIFLAAGFAVWRLVVGGYPLELGGPIDQTSAVGLADVLRSPEPITGERIVLRGRVGQVCRSVGCWFVLQEVTGDRLYEVLVDLKRDGTFTIPKDATGRTALVSGKLVGAGSDTKFEADGVRLQ